MGESFALIYGMLFVSCLIFTIVLNSILLKFLKTLGTKDQPGKVMVRWSAQSKPAIGGISFFIAFLLSLSAGSIFAGDRILGDLQLAGWVAAGTLAFVTGLADDAFNTNPLMKFLAQLSCGLLLYSTGTAIEVFSWEWLNALITVLWVVGMMNSINMLDNMDAITTIVSLFILIFLQLILAINAGIDSFPFIIFLGLTGTLMGFLGHNWHPSKIFMGDSGSQFLGLILAAGAIMFCWNYDFGTGHGIDGRNIFLPIIVFLLPIADTTLVTINRILHRRSPFVGGRDHSTHNFSYLGMRDNFVAVTFSFMSMIHLVFAVAMILFIKEWSILWTLVYSGWILFVILTLFGIARKNRKDKKYTYE